MIVWWLINVDSNTLGAFSRVEFIHDQGDIMAAGWYHSAEDISDEGSEGVKTFMAKNKRGELN